MERIEKQPDHAVKRKVKLIVMTALFTALSYVATSVLMVPSPTGGYLNLGDAVILLGAYLLGPVYGAVAGGLGPALADLLAGYGVYVPATLVIKALMAFTAAALYRLLGRKRWAPIVCGIAAETIMIAGYFLYDGLLAGSLAGGLAGVISNLVQAVFGIAASVLLTAALKRSDAVCRSFPEV